jgi:hypothetical protein
MCNRFRNAGLALTLGFASVMTFGSLRLVAQEPPAGKADDATKPAAKRVSDPSRRVPNFFGQLGLTTEQREEIYRIRGKHQQKIAELEKQIAEMRAAMLTECEGVLTETQKQLLNARRRAAAEKKTAKAASPSATTSSKAPER